MNDVDLKVFIHLEVDVLHVHLVQVYQRLVLQCDALLDVLHLEVSLETGGVICMFSITNLTWLNKILFCSVIVRILDCSLKFDLVISCSLCKVHLVYSASSFLL